MDREVVTVDLSQFKYLVGEMNGWSESAGDLPLIDNGDGTASVTFTPKAAEQQFDLLQGKTWSGQMSKVYDFGMVFPNDSVDNGQGGFNAVMKGLTPDTPCTATFTPNNDGTITIKIEGGGSGAVAKQPINLNGYFVIGDVVGGWTPTADKNLLFGGDTDLAANPPTCTYTWDFDFTSGSTGFRIAKADYKGGWGSTNTLTVGGDEIELTDELKDNGEAENITVTGLEVGKSYRLVFTTTDTKVSVKVFALVQNTLKFKVTGLSEDDEVFLNGDLKGGTVSGWGSAPQWPFAGWCGSNPGAWDKSDEGGCYTACKTANGSDRFATAENDGVAKFAFTITVKGKIGDQKSLGNVRVVPCTSDGANPAWDIDNVEVKYALKADGSDIVCTYVRTGSETKDNAWTVE